MNIIYRTDYNFTKDDCVELFKSVNWHSANYPDLLYEALKNYPGMFHAWDNDKLVGMVATLDDGCMNAYVHYVLVNPEYQKYNIGYKLMCMNNEKYKDYVNVVLIAYNNVVGFYEKLGYKVNKEACAMLIK